jgi:hypothetical protein
MAVDIKHAGAVFFGVDDMLVPNLVVKGASHGFSFFLQLAILSVADIKMPRQVHTWRGIDSQ